MGNYKGREELPNADVAVHFWMAFTGVLFWYGGFYEFGAQVRSRSRHPWVCDFFLVGTVLIFIFGV